jgi:hypothetical protein
MPRVVCFFITVFLLVVFFAYPPSTVSALNRIGVRQGTTGGEFYDTVTNAKFVPRGNNYVVLGQVNDPWGSGMVQGHIQFDPGKYNAAGAQAILWQII